MAKIALKSVLRRPKSKFARIHGQDDIMSPLIKPPRLLRATPKLTVEQLLKTVTAEQRERARDIAIKKLGTVNLPKSSKVIPPDTLAYRIQTYSKHNKHIHNVSIFCTDGNPFSAHSKLIVDCSCASHVYHFENPLAKRGNAMLWRSNGADPTVYTKLGICKHTQVALRYMLRQARYGVLPRKKAKTHKRISLIRGN